MKTVLVGLFLLSSVSASANPMLEKCLALAPKSCALTDTSIADDFLACFDGKVFDPAKPVEAACDEELSHARVHRACDDKDIPALCKGVKPGADRVMTCLRKNSAKLGKDCRNALKSYDLLRGTLEKGNKGERKKGRYGVASPRC